MLTAPNATRWQSLPSKRTKNAMMDGNEAVARSAYPFTDIAFLYPITPATPAANAVTEWAKKVCYFFCGLCILFYFLG